jgi:hypothetical protein
MVLSGFEAPVFGYIVKHCRGPDEIYIKKDIFPLQKAGQHSR